ncbi:MAG: putative monovalent cation/H+ antiporter subunit A [Acidobacteria bacterium]|nr:putative monovalent cation/H+ antiporter subunit A [Acidobacteriota bacterium]
MVFAFLSGFVLSAVAPSIHHRAPRAAGWLLALLPLSLTIWFLSHVPGAAHGEVARSVHDWVPSLGITLSFHLDGLSLLFALIVAGIGALVLIYSGAYMAGDRHTGRLYAFLLIFMAAMIGVVTADNVILLYISWELTSISSYLLIGYKHEYEKSRKAALQALLVTGAGGLALLPGLIMLATVGGSYELSELSAQGDLFRSHALYVPILLCVLAGAFTKSAQVPFHFWLPSAMEAPTPISTYLHSATMVKAGVFLLMRLTPVLGGTEAWTAALTTFGATTMVVGAWLGTQQTDLKRILAFTTVMALGAMTMLVGVGSPVALEAAMVFLLAHALYKGSLFMVVGAIDHGTGTREITALSGLRRAMPVTAWAAGLAALSTAGLVPLFGFVAKETAYTSLLGAPALVVAAVVANACVFLSAGVVGYQTFFGEPRETPHHPHEAPPAMWIGPMLLASLGLLLGVAPALADGLIGAAASASLGAPRDTHLALWHGLEGDAGAALALSATTIAAGLLAYAARWRLLALGAVLRHAYAFGPERWYEWTLAGLMASARWQTKVLQNGYLRFYILTAVLVTVVFGGYVIATAVAVPVPADLADARFHEVLLLLIMLAATWKLLHTESRFVAIVALGVIGYGVALLFLFFGAPDLAMTQFAIETLGVVLFVLVLYRMPELARRSPAVARARDAAVALGLGGLVTVILLATTPDPSPSRLSTFFAEESVPSAFGRNIVNVILVDFRGLDTLGEITVLAIAALGVYALLKLRLHGGES